MAGIFRCQFRIADAGISPYWYKCYLAYNSPTLRCLVNHSPMGGSGRIPHDKCSSPAHGSAFRQHWASYNLHARNFIIWNDGISSRFFTLDGYCARSSVTHHIDDLLQNISRNRSLYVSGYRISNGYLIFYQNRAR